MKLYKSIIASLAALAALTGFSSCDGDLDMAPVVTPLGPDTSDMDGSANAPLNVLATIAYYNAYYSDAPDASRYYWTTGYIVGCAATTETVFVANDETSQFSAPFGSNYNILLAADPAETDYNNCIAIQLPSTVRSAINLKDNPGNKGLQITLHGYIDKYLGLPGMCSVDAFNWGAEGIPGMEPVIFREASSITSGKGYGFVAVNSSTYTMARPADAGANYGWLYVTNVTDNSGVIKGDEANAFVFTEATDGSYYITDSYGRYLYMSGTFNSFQLSNTLDASDDTFRWIPSHNSDGTWTIVNVGNSKTIQYYIEKTSFGAYAEVASQGYLLPHLYEMDGEPAKPDVPDNPDTPDNPDNPDVPTPPATGGTGEKDSPYTCSQVIALNPTSTQEAVATGVWAEGYIVGSMPTGGSSTTLSSTNFSTTDAATTNMVIAPTADCTDYTMCIGIQLSSTIRGELALANKPDNLGKKVKLCGDVMKYCGGPGLKNVTAYELEGQSGSDTPTPSGDAIYTALSSTDADLTTGWRYDDISLGSDLSYVWTWKEYNSAHYLNASAYFNGAAVPAESYAVSPVISLAGAKGCAVSFEHAAKFQTTLLTEGSGLYVREKGQTAWTRLDIPVWPEAGSWTWVSSGSISLAAYDGKEIELAFRYVSTSAGADTWEIRNLKVTGNK